MGHKVGVSLLLLGVAVLGVADAQEGRCLTPERNVGNCINLKQCPPLLGRLTSPNRQQSDVQYLRDSQCGFEGSTPKVCCPVNTAVPERTPTNFGPPNGNFGQSVGGNFGQQGGNFVQPIADADLIPIECGKDLSVRIHGGNVTGIDEYPWMTLLEYRKPNGKTTACGGALINKRYVLTAAHCIKGKTLPRTWKLESVRLGEYNTATDRDCVPEGDNGDLKCADDPVTVRIEEQIVHEDYAPLSNDQRYDIALLRLNRDVSFTDYIKPICLPKTSNIPSKLVASGWGSTESRKESDIKLKVSLPIVDMRECSSVYQRNGVTLGEGQICAGGQKGFDSCRGDSGGPLMQQVTGEAPDFIPKWTVHGIVSFGPSPCGMEGFPGIYTKVYDYMPWIRKNVRA